MKHLGAVFCHVCFPHDCNDYDVDDSDVMMMMMTVMVLGSSFTTTNNAFGEISLFFGSFQGCLVAWVVVVCISFPGLLAFTALSLILIHITRRTFLWEQTLIHTHAHVIPDYCYYYYHYNHYNHSGGWMLWKMERWMGGICVVVENFILL